MPGPFGGVGRKGGFGYLHDRRFAQPFANAVREVVRRYAYGTHEGAVLPLRPCAQTLCADMHMELMRVQCFQNTSETRSRKLKTFAGKHFSIRG
jgi:hypothetical protein